MTLMLFSFLSRPVLGFNPMWNKHFEFEIDVPALALVRFLVEDFDASSRNDFVAQFTVPLTSLQLGTKPLITSVFIIVVVYIAIHFIILAYQHLA